jgi:hypothetical protein
MIKTSFTYLYKTATVTCVNSFNCNVILLSNMLLADTRRTEFVNFIICWNVLSVSVCVSGNHEYKYYIMNPEKRQRLSLTKSRSCSSKDDKLRAASKNSGNIIDLFRKQQSQLDSVLVDLDDVGMQCSCNAPLANDKLSCTDNESRKVHRLSLKRISRSVCCLSSSSTVQSGLTSASLNDETCDLENADDNLVCIPQRDFSAASCNATVCPFDSGVADDDSASGTVQLLSATCTDAATLAGVEVAENAEVVDSFTVPYTPYYLESFLLVVDTILDDNFYSYLFSDEDHVAVYAFRNLSG